MSKLEELIKEFCPNGVEHKKLGETLKIERGVRVVKSQLTTQGIYPVYQNSLTPMGYYDKFNFSAETAFIIGAGSAGEIGYSNTDFWAADDCYCLICNENLNSRYLYHCLLNNSGYITSKVRKASIPRLSRGVIESLQIPLPALPVQREIVQILDSFTLYSAELTAELTARRKQYEFYRDKLLNFGNAKLVVKNKKLKELCMSIKDGMHNLPVTTDENTGYPVLSAMNIYDGQIHYDAKRFVSREVFEQESKRTKIETGDVLLTIVATIGRTAVVENSTSFLLQRSVCALKPSKEILSKYLKYYLDTNAIQNYIFANAHGSAQAGLYLNQVADIEVVLPPMEVQERIVKVLDNFDAICSDLGIGLPAEIEKRQKQYEYYREKLLTFDMKSETILRQTDRQTGLIRLLQYIYGFAFVRLEDVADYSTNRITAKSVDKNNYIGVDNLLADRQGKTESVYVPENGNLIEFRSENTLIGNIRPYLKKIWFANCNGGTNGDVLVIKSNENFVEAKYLYYVLSSDKFFAFDMQYAKGAKMPRGNKEAIMTYQFSLPTLEKQKEIVDILDRFDNLCNDISKGLPAEIEARQKQYEFYRDKLLTFKG